MTTLYLAVRRPTGLAILAVCCLGRRITGITDLCLGVKTKCTQAEMRRVRWLMKFTP